MEPAHGCGMQSHGRLRQTLPLVSLLNFTKRFSQPAPIASLCWICSALLPLGKRILQRVVPLKPQHMQQVMKSCPSVLPAKGRRVKHTYAARCTKEKNLQQKESQNHPHVVLNLPQKVPLFQGKNDEGQALIQAQGSCYGAGVKPLGSSEHPAQEPASSSREEPVV